MNHLCFHSYKKIAYIGGIEGEADYDNKARFEGYRKALMENSREIKEEYLLNGQYTLEGGYNALMKLMRLSDPPDALFAANDEMAIGILQACKRLGINIPSDLGLIGFDNIRICQYTSLTLRTVDQPRFNIWVILCEKLFYSIYNKALTLKSINIPLKPQLVTRESCGCE